MFISTLTGQQYALSSQKEDAVPDHILMNLALFRIYDLKTDILITFNKKLA